MILRSKPLALLRIGAWAPPTLAKSTLPETSAAIAEGPPRMKMVSTLRPWSLKKPLAIATRNGNWLFQVRLTETTRSAFFSWACDSNGVTKIRKGNNRGKRCLFGLDGLNFLAACPVPITRNLRVPDRGFTVSVALHSSVPAALASEYGR